MGGAGPALAFGLLALPWLCFPGPLGAQSGASLQVAARVLNVEPSRAALSRAASWPDSSGTRVATSLAVVRIDRMSGQPPSPGQAERQRAVVTIIFLHN